MVTEFGLENGETFWTIQSHKPIDVIEREKAENVLAKLTIHVDRPADLVACAWLVVADETPGPMTPPTILEIALGTENVVVTRRGDAGMNTPQPRSG